MLTEIHGIYKVEEFKSTQGLANFAKVFKNGKHIGSIVLYPNMITRTYGFFILNMDIVIDCKQETLSDAINQVLEYLENKDNNLVAEKYFLVYLESETGLRTYYSVDKYHALSFSTSYKPTLVTETTKKLLMNCITNSEECMTVKEIKLGD